MIFMTTFGQRLSRLRNDKRLSQEELAARLKISKSAIGMYERDQREPSFELLDEMALFFDVSVDYLMGRTDKRNSLKTDREEPVVQLLMRSKDEMTPESFDRLSQVIEELTKAFVEEVDKKLDGDKK